MTVNLLKNLYIKTYMFFSALLVFLLHVMFLYVASIYKCCMYINYST